MKYAIRKICLMHLVLSCCRGDRNRQREARQAVMYIAVRPWLLFMQKRCSHRNRSVEKSIRFIMSAPYNDEIYAHFCGKE